MSSNLPRGLLALEMLVRHPAGMPLHAIAAELQIPRSTAHRILAELAKAGYVQQQAGDFSPYRPTLKIATLGMQFLSATGVVELVQPVLDKLAAASGELARMSIVENDRLIWVAKAQGARGGLRYDAQSDPGEDVRLFCSSNGQAWLSTLSDQKALEVVSRQGFGESGQFGPNAPRTIEAFLESIRLARERGYAVVHETYEIGLAAIAAPVRHPNTDAAIGAVSIAGPEARLKHAEHLVPLILDAARELSALSPGIRACGR
ncbi:IclR family transcriptional regulator [Castellaniella sp. S9]|uniref:IclR family transcriptional regulator n=1 Tax=Castellaniella sp. S9 TaxID=2993652 RepID=UPI0022B2CCE4|nr:IclR family transcriptional regulator [Castellaniella sp. S9]